VSDVGEDISMDMSTRVRTGDEAVGGGWGSGEVVGGGPILDIVTAS
jgi:hypothetical protein